jgi:hypothetical protein
LKKRKKIKEEYANDYYVGTEKNYADVLKIAGLNVCETERTFLLNSLSNMGLIKSTYNSSVLIQCIDKEGKDFAIKFLMGENFVKNYTDFVGHKNLIVCCKICGKSFERKGSRQVMCEDCSKKSKLEKKRKNNYGCV